MKTMKKAFALVLALALVLSLTVPAFAAPDSGNFMDDVGSITINGAIEGTTYTIYRIFDLASFSTPDNKDEGLGEYSYKIRQYRTTLTPEQTAADNTKVDLWQAFANNSFVRGKFITLDSEGYVKWVAGASRLTFASEAAKYIADKSVPNDGHKTSEPVKDNDENIIGYQTVFTDLPLGYYLVVSSKGENLILVTTNKDVVVTEKNGTHTVEKFVKEDSGSWQESNTVDIGQEVEFFSAIKVEHGAKNLRYHDTMDAGLDFVEGSVVVLKGKGVAGNSDIVDPTNYTVHENVGEHAFGDSTNIHNCTFEVQFDDAFIQTIVPGQYVTVYYKAIVTDAFEIEVPEYNDSVVSYGGGNWTNWDTTETVTYGFGIFKHKAGNLPLADAHFDLKRGTGANVEYAILEITDMVAGVDGEGNPTTVPAADDNDIYKDEATIKNMRFVGWTTDPALATNIVTPASGRVWIVGLDADTYYLEETKAPEGFELLADDITIVINNKGEVTRSGELVADKYAKVENEAGALLPSTGGMGTTMLYAFGSLLALSAAVLLITKRRMSF